MEFRWYLLVLAFKDDTHSVLMHFIHILLVLLDLVDHIIPVHIYIYYYIFTQYTVYASKDQTSIPKLKRDPQQTPKFTEVNVITKGCSNELGTFLFGQPSFVRSRFRIMKQPKNGKQIPGKAGMLADLHVSDFDKLRFFNLQPFVPSMANYFFLFCARNLQSFLATNELPPVILEGDPGVGRTALLEATRNANGLSLSNHFGVKIRGQWLFKFLIIQRSMNNFHHELVTYS